jgi:hypothetical protein
VVTLSALWSGALCLTYVAAAAAVSAAHSGAAPPDSVCPLRSRCPSEVVPVCLALQALCPTPSPTFSSSSSSARLRLYPSSCRLPSVKEKIEDYRMARDENKHDMYLEVRVLKHSK